MHRCKQLAGAVLLLAGIGGSAQVLAHGGMMDDAHGAEREVLKEQKVWGIAGDRERISRTVEIGMSDRMRFTPDRLQVKLGETIRFVHRNEGRMLHEFVLGTRPVLDEHAAMMVEFPGMEHDEPYMAHVAPGQGSEIVWTFNRTGEFDFACLLAGHYQAGMVGQIEVVAE